MAVIYVRVAARPLEDRLVRVVERIAGRTKRLGPVRKGGRGAAHKTTCGTQSPIDTNGTQRLRIRRCPPTRSIVICAGRSRLRSAKVSRTSRMSESGSTASQLPDWIRRLDHDFEGAIAGDCQLLGV